MRAARRAACALLISLGACGGPGNETASTHHPAAVHGSAPAPQLTVAQARSVFTAFLPKFERLGSAPSLATQLTTWPETSAWALSQTERYGVKPVAAAPSGERFLVPYLTAYPRWFLAAGSAGSQRDFMFVMVEQAPGAAWRAAAEMYDVYQPPQILAALNFEKLTASGYARTVVANDGSLTTEPPALSSEYAQYLNDSAQGPQQSSFLAGGYTTNYVKTTQQIAAGAKAAGWTYTETQAGIAQPTYALRVPDGALVIFYTRDIASWTARSSSAVTSPGAPGSGYAPPPWALSALNLKTPRPGLRVSLTVIDENLALVALAGAQKVGIIVNDPKTISYAKS